jgi:hypothetical protein
MATANTLLRDLPLNRVVRLSGVSAEDVAAELGRSDGLPACVLVEPRGSGSVAAFVSEVLDTLDAIARQLLPGWLPEADGLDGPQGAAIAAIRAVAIERARAAGHSSAFLADLAERALTGRPARARSRPEARIAGLARVVATAFHRGRLVLVVPVAARASAEPVVVSAAEWLADRGRVGVWLTGTGSAGAERMASVQAGLTPPPGFTEGIGKPHPRSSVEAALEIVLKRQPWAYGRIWNGTYQPALLRSPIRPDLWWPAERVVVELDGLEHCRPDQYDADRVRDVRLQLDGYAVLRFTNARVRHDVQAVVAQIELLIRNRRHDMTKEQQGG